MRDGTASALTLSQDSRASRRLSAAQRRRGQEFATQRHLVFWIVFPVMLLATLGSIVFLALEVDHQMQVAREFAPEDAVFLQEGIPEDELPPCTQRSALEQRRVIDGICVRQDEFPSMVAIIVKHMNNSMVSLCSGVLVSHDWVLTAAHCEPPETSVVTHVLSDCTDITDAACKHRLVDRHVVSPCYYMDPYADLMMMHLREAMPSNIPLRKFNGVHVDLPDMGIGTLITAYGYGMMTLQGGHRFLFAADSVTAAPTACRAGGNTRVPYPPLCSFESSTVTAKVCYGDSGGAVVNFDGIVVALVMGTVHSLQHPDVHPCALSPRYTANTDLRPFGDWIRNIVASTDPLAPAQSSCRI